YGRVAGASPGTVTSKRIWGAGAGAENVHAGPAAFRSATPSSVTASLVGLAKCTSTWNCCPGMAVVKLTAVVIITGLSGSGKGSVVKVFEDPAIVHRLRRGLQERFARELDP